MSTSFPGEQVEHAFNSRRLNNWEVSKTPKNQVDLSASINLVNSLHSTVNWKTGRPHEVYQHFWGAPTVTATPSRYNGAGQGTGWGTADTLHATSTATGTPGGPQNGGPGQLKGFADVDRFGTMGDHLNGKTAPIAGANGHLLPNGGIMVNHKVMMAGKVIMAHNAMEGAMDDGRAEELRRMPLDVSRTYNAFTKTVPVHLKSPARWPTSNVSIPQRACATMGYKGIQTDTYLPTSSVHIKSVEVPGAKEFNYSFR